MSKPESFTARTKNKCTIYKKNKAATGDAFRCVLEKSTEENMIQTYLWCFKCRHGEIMKQMNIFDQDRGCENEI